MVKIKCDGGVQSCRLFQENRANLTMIESMWHQKQRLKLRLFHASRGGEAWGPVKTGRYKCIQMGLATHMCTLHKKYGKV